MKRHELVYLFCLSSLLMTACSGEKKETATEEGGVSTVLPEAKNDVSVLALRKQAFNHELISNGKVFARGQADLRFESSEVIAHIYVKNGDRVQKGQKLAELDKFKLGNRLAQAKDALEKAKLELKDVLIGQGYTVDDFDKVPEETMKLAKVKSGYEQTRVQYELTKREEEHATLTAPFEGLVANLFAKAHNMANTSEAFCRIVDTQGMEADFTVLESELPLIKKNDQVIVTPYADATHRYEGRISEVNPLVDDNGMVKVKAQVNGKGQLFSGMNVRISVRRSLGDQLVIPKTAVVLRTGKQVVFTLENGKAKWNYVLTGLENAESCIVSNKADVGVTDGLLEGDTVIITGNVNLAHEAEVMVSD